MPLLLQREARAASIDLRGRHRNLGRRERRAPRRGLRIVRRPQRPGRLLDELSAHYLGCIATGRMGRRRERFWEPLWNWFRQRAFSVPDSVNSVELWARAILFAFLLLLSYRYVSASVERSQVSWGITHFLLSRVNLVFHEAGHVLLGFFGELIAALGGSLMQVAVPVVCAVTFLRHVNPFGAAVATWWAGQSLIDLAPYIYDARSQRMVLLGGVTGRDVPGYHDWNNVLSRLGLLQYDHGLARLAHLTGALLILAALMWGGYLLLVQYRNREALL